MASGRTTTRRADSPTTREILREATTTAVARLAGHTAHALRGDDVEDLHQSRVAARRLRSDLRTFAPLLNEAWAGELRAELKWFGEVLGAVRDRDVLRGRLEAAVSDLAPEDVPAGRALIARLADERAAAVAAMVQAVSGRRYEQLLDDLRIAADAPKFDRDPDRDARPVLAKLVRRAWTRLERAVADLDEQPTDEELHDVRIRAKRVRYAAEAAAPAWGKSARRVATAAESVQDVLGTLNDAAVAERWLRVAARSAPEVAFVAGVLAERERHAAASCRSEFSRVWRRAAKPKRREWLQ